MFGVVFRAASCLSPLKWVFANISSSNVSYHLPTMKERSLNVATKVLDVMSYIFFFIAINNMIILIVEAEVEFD